MTLKQELEELRGESIDLRKPASEIPCNEIVDKDKICRNPVVSVAMLTYKHAKYIAQAIEGVMMQVTDFEYELIISDDASPDQTKTIAEEYQLKYPDKIRILWSESNLNHIAGNGIRLWVRCRGEFMALCEGDDYWIDPHKLQKQVDVMRKYPNVTLCAGDVKSLLEERGTAVASKTLQSLWKEGVNSGSEVFKAISWLPTCTLLLRKSIYDKATSEFEIFQWRLCLRDVLLTSAMAYYGDIYVFYDCFGVYRSHPGGATREAWPQIVRDCGVIFTYFAITTGRLSVKATYEKVGEIIDGRCKMLAKFNYRERKRHIQKLLQNPTSASVVIRNYGILGIWLMQYGSLFDFMLRIRSGLRRRFLSKVGGGDK